MADATAGVIRAHISPRLLVAAAAVLGLFLAFATVGIDTRGDLVADLVFGAIPAVPLITETSRWFRVTSLIEGLLLIIGGTCMGVLPIIPSAIVLMVAACEDPMSTRFRTQFFGATGAIIVITTAIGGLTMIHW